MKVGFRELKSALVQQLYVRILRVSLCVWFSPELWFSAIHCEVRCEKPYAKEEPLQGLRQADTSCSCAGFGA